MDQIDIDAAYDQRFYAPMGYQIPKRIASVSDAVRARLGEPLRLSYGPSEIEKLDVYRARKPNAPIFIFIHGGSWLGGTARNHGYPAEMFVNAGANFIAIDFIQIKEAGGDLRVMAGQVRSAIAWVYKNAASFGADASRLYIGGRSSGAHLTGVALVTDWARDYGVPADIVKGGVCSSGMYDLKPVRISKRSSFVKFTDEMEEAMSSQRHLDQLRAPVVVTYGTNETPEFQRQNARFRRGRQGRRQERRTDRGAELQPLRNGRILRQSLRSERPRRALVDEAADSRIELAVFAGHRLARRHLVYWV